MFAALFSRLTGAVSPAPDPVLDAQFAIAALLVRIAKADAHYAFEEIAEIDRIIGRTWGLNPIAAMKLRAQAERVEAGAPEADEPDTDQPDTDELTRLVQDHTPYDQRLALYGALWDVSLADRKLHDDERSFLDDIAAALAITAEDKAASAAGPDLDPETHPETHPETSSGTAT